MPAAESPPLFVILGDQLFPPALLRPHRHARFYMAEDIGLCTRVRHHKQKLALFLAAMRAYRDDLHQSGFDVHYEPLPETPAAHPVTYIDKLGRHLKTRPARQLIMWEIEDKFFESEIRTFVEQSNLDIKFLPSPMFLTTRDESAEWLADNRPFMASFYRWQRERLGVLLNDDSEPAGGRWSYDADNRERLPKDVAIPDPPRAAPTEHVDAVIPLINKLFPDHPGDLSRDTW